jgi:hypothetical protein
LGLNSIRIDTHISDQPRFDGFRAALAEVHVVLIAAERIRMAFDPENRLRIPLNQMA